MGSSRIIRPNLPRQFNCGLRMLHFQSKCNILEAIHGRTGISDENLCRFRKAKIADARDVVQSLNHTPLNLFLRLIEVRVMNDSALPPKGTAEVSI